MSYLNIGGGCDSCSTVGMDVPMTQMGMDNNSNLVANMVNVPQIDNSMNTMNNMNSINNMNNMNSINNMNNMNNMNTMSNTNMSTNNNHNNAVAVNNALNNAVMNNTVMNNAVMNNNTKVNQPVQNINNQMNNQMNTKKRAVVSPTNLIMFGLVIFAALASNETAMYHLNQAVKFNEANPMYYIVYMVVAILLCFSVYHYMTSN